MYPSVEIDSILRQQLERALNVRRAHERIDLDAQVRQQDSQPQRLLVNLCCRNVFRLGGTNAVLISTLRLLQWTAACSSMDPRNSTSMRNNDIAGGGSITISKAASQYPMTTPGSSM